MKHWPIPQYRKPQCGPPPYETHQCLNSISSLPQHIYSCLHWAVVAFRRSNNLTNFLARAKLGNLWQNNTHPRDYFQCGSHCSTCTIQPTYSSHTFHSTGDTRAIAHHIICHFKNPIYMIQCKRCHTQHVGQTKRRLKDCEHCRPADKPTKRFKPTTLSEQSHC